MHCRSYLLLEKEVMQLKEEHLFGIAVTPLSDDLLRWLAEIKALKNSIWEGYTFPLLMKFSVKYNDVPPAVAFSTIPFHPNVDPKTGRPCLDFLDNPNLWNKDYTLKSILLSLQVVLSYPTVENPVNLEAAKMMMEDVVLYKQMAMKSVRSVDSSDEESIEDERDIIFFKSEESPDLNKGYIKGISFDEYYKTWSGIATSQTANSSKVPVSQSPNLVENFKKWKGKQKTSRDWDAKFHSIMARISRENRLPARIDRSLIKSIKDAQIYTTPDPNVLNPENQDELMKMDKDKEKKSPKESDDMDESWEKEVENLVAWTNSLSTMALED